MLQALTPLHALHPSVLIAAPVRLRALTPLQAAPAQQLQALAPRLRAAAQAGRAARARAPSQPRRAARAQARLRSRGAVRVQGPSRLRGAAQARAQSPLQAKRTISNSQGHRLYSALKHSAWNTREHARFQANHTGARWREPALSTSGTHVRRNQSPHAASASVRAIWAHGRSAPVKACWTSSCKACALALC